MLFHLMLLAVIGLAISVYSYLTEQRIKQDVNYKPFCDLSDTISCSKPLLSPYAKFFSISNSVAGIIFYSVMFVLGLLGMPKILMLSTLVACFISCGLGYLLYVRIQAFCILCSSLYIINFLLLWYSVKALFFK